MVTRAGIPVWGDGQGADSCSFLAEAQSGALLTIILLFSVVTLSGVPPELSGAHKVFIWASSVLEQQEATGDIIALRMIRCTPGPARSGKAAMPITAMRGRRDS